MIVADAVQADQGTALAHGANRAIFDAAPQKYCRIYDVLFQKLRDVMDLNDYQLANGVNFALTNPLYRLRFEVGRANANYEVLTLSDMSILAGFFAARMRLGG